MTPNSRSFFLVELFSPLIETFDKQYICAMYISDTWWI